PRRALIRARSIYTGVGSGDSRTDASTRNAIVKMPERQSLIRGGVQSSVALKVEHSEEAGVLRSRLSADPLGPIPRVAVRLRPGLCGGGVALDSPRHRDARGSHVVGEPRARKPLGSSALLRRPVGPADALVRRPPRRGEGVRRREAGPRHQCWPERQRTPARGPASRRNHALTLSDSFFSGATPERPPELGPVHAGRVEGERDPGGP